MYKISDAHAPTEIYKTSDLNHFSHICTTYIVTYYYHAPLRHLHPPLIYSGLPPAVAV
jgi:hypothetical protein